MALAGETIAASDIPVITSYNVIQSAALTLTTTFTDVTGVTQTFSTSRANATAVVFATCDFFITVAIGAGGLTGGQVVVDGVAQAGQADLNANIANRGTAGVVWTGTLASSGSHTIKLQARKTINAGTAAIETQTKMVIMVIEQ